MGFTANNNYEILEYMVEEDDLNGFDEIMLNDFLKDIVGVSTNQIRDFKRHKVLKVNGMKMSLSANIRLGDIINAKFIEGPHNILPENIPVDICYEDMDVVCVNKDRDMVSHPTKGHPEHTMSNALMYYGMSKGEHYKPRLINRLDMNTTGIILFGKNPYAQHHVSEQMANGNIQKRYLAIIQGDLKISSGKIDNYIYKTDDGIKRAVSDLGEGKRCITEFSLIKSYGEYSLVELNLLTGRTHQIRVHMSYLGHPILGDFLYGADETLSQKYEISRQLLHAYKLCFHSPRSGNVRVIANPPADMMKLIESDVLPK